MADTRQDHVDPVFEFEAPKYIDFATSVENEAEDVWFGMLGHIHSLSLSCLYTVTDTQKSSVEELKTTDLLETNNNEDFGTSTIDADNTFIEPVNRKRSEDTSSYDTRPAKKHRTKRHPVQHQEIPLTVPESPCFATSSYVIIYLFILFY